ncbi:MAG TPA: hydantoinase/oxoprolinase family protein [Trebonia sp.]|jgi:N-methylhydantoinase A|nr:hydantoinase/oxoprolinase family protein [Trebonia sp.]
MAIAISTDIGGTFTDLVVYDLSTGTIHQAKDYTDPDDLSSGIARCVDKSGFSLVDAPEFVHGSTVAINAAIERKGAPTALLVTRGMRDVYEIGRGNRPEAYNLMFKRPVPLVGRESIYEVDERLAAGGDVITPLDEASVRRAVEAAVAGGARAIAVCLLHSYANPAHEERIGAIVAEVAPQLYLTLSHQILREYREYERISTAAMNAYIGPRVSGYLDDLKGVLSARAFGGRTLIMQSNGGVMTLDVARDEPVMMMESGPVGGVIAAGAIAASRAIVNAVAFDMGGTTAKAALLRQGTPDIAQGYYVGGFASGLPVRVPVVDVVEIGAGGGSIAHLDDAGALRIGPESAGGRPGPVCYGWGGTRPTVTDANAVLGRLNPARFLGGEMGLDTAAAAAAFDDQLGQHLNLSAEQGALAVINIAVNMMGLAVRSVSIERGVDPRECALIAFGGAGPLHACAVARELKIPRVIIPMLPGHFSALGMLLADIRHEQVRTIYREIAGIAGDELISVADEVRDHIAGLLTAELIAAGDQEVELYLDLRYRGQEFTLRTPAARTELSTDAGLEKVRQRFDELHALRFGHSAAGSPVEVVNLRVVGIGRRERFSPTLAAHEGGIDITTRRVVSGAGSQSKAADWQVYQREQLPAGYQVTGPAVIEEYASTLVIDEGDVATVSDDGALDIQIAVAGPAGSTEGAAQ